MKIITAAIIVTCLMSGAAFAWTHGIGIGPGGFLVDNASHNLTTGLGSSLLAQ